jgi:hypothetical protein
MRGGDWLIALPDITTANITTTNITTADITNVGNKMARADARKRATGRHGNAPLAIE